MEKKMQIIENELIVGIDFDDTLVMWSSPTISGPGKIEIEFAGKTVYLIPHQYHIDLVKMYKERGYFVIGWSANGKTHAQRVIAALKLEEYFDLVMTKLTKHLDDSTDPYSILGPRVYCDDLTKPNLPVPNFIGGSSIRIDPSIVNVDMRGVLNGR